MPLNGNYAPSTSERARANVETIIASGGTEGMEVNGKAVVLLTCVGAKTGAIRKTPMIRVEHHGHYAIVASLRGGPKNPAWYHNVKAHPHVELRDGTHTGDYHAREVFDDEKAEWWARAVAVYPDYADYQTKTSRQIPLIVLTPIDP
jgi:F420H(2)-dependent quinone reductase